MRASVIVPAFNAAAFIGDAVESVLRQTEPRCEVIVIDDASADDTAAVVARMAEQNGRVRLLRNRYNRGPAASRNRGIAEAVGDWILLLDADDEFLPQRIQHLLALGEEHSADLVADNLLLCSEDGTGAGTPMLGVKVLPELKWLTPAEFVDGNIGSRRTPRVNYGFLQPAIRRRFLRLHRLRYDERNRFGEDFMLALACLLRGARWLITPEPLYRYRIRSGSLTDVQSAGDLARIAAMERGLLDGHPMVEADPALAHALRRHHRKIQHFYYYRAFVDAVKRGATDQAFSLLFENIGAFHNIVSESLTQAPRIARKALSGGYRNMGD